MWPFKFLFFFYVSSWKETKIFLFSSLGRKIREVKKKNEQRQTEKAFQMYFGNRNLTLVSCYKDLLQTTIKKLYMD